uniref:Uncharacterized protein n=1 Tax=Anopheles epiroticus TaxID=199890 RepID=A0A182PEP4_9DIPT
MPAFGLAAVRTLQGMNRDEERSLSVSPPLTGQRQQHHLGMNFQHTPSLYGGFHPATASAMGMLAPQLLAANQTAAAALMAAGLPMSLRASLATGLFPPHAALFGAWAPPTPTSNNSSPPPPQSPISPALSHKSSKSLKLSAAVSNNNNNSSSTNNNHIVSTTSEIVPQTKKLTKRKHQASSRKESSAAAHHHHHLHHLMRSPSHSHHLSIPVDIPVSPGPISPPTSGSSPQSNGSVELPTTITTTTSSSASSNINNSPAASGDHLSDHGKSVCGGSESSDLSLDGISKIPTTPGMLLHQKFPGLTLPLNFGPLAADGTTDSSTAAMDLRASSRSRTPQQIAHIKSELPEQTEPEDLSMHSPRSPVSMEELDELDDAATLYLKQRQQLLQQQHHGMEL